MLNSIYLIESLLVSEEEKTETNPTPNCPIPLTFLFLPAIVITRFLSSSSSSLKIFPLFIVRISLIKQCLSLFSLTSSVDEIVSVEFQPIHKGILK